MADILATGKLRKKFGNFSKSPLGHPQIVKFGEKYKQWNAAFDAGFAAANGKSLIVMHSKEHQHALKEVDAAALAVVENPDQVVQILKYVLDGRA